MKFTVKKLTYECYIVDNGERSFVVRKTGELFWFHNPYGDVAFYDFIKNNPKEIAKEIMLSEMQ